MNTNKIKKLEKQIIEDEFKLDVNFFITHEDAGAVAIRVYENKQKLLKLKKGVEK